MLLICADFELVRQWPTEFPENRIQHIPDPPNGGFPQSKDLQLILDHINRRLPYRSIPRIHSVFDHMYIVESCLSLRLMYRLMCEAEDLFPGAETGKQTPRFTLEEIVAALVSVFDIGDRTLGLCEVVQRSLAEHHNATASDLFLQFFELRSLSELKGQDRVFFTTLKE